MTAYYNENNLDAADTLRELIKAGVIANGDVDTRSIEDVTPNDVKGYTQCHWFAGIGGWSRALRLAGWDDNRPAWTGSCPCQPFSAAGKGAGVNDERHLWPTFHHLISQCRPAVIFGEQVASKQALEWWDIVAADLEGSGYATAAADLPAASVQAPHLRSRLFWLATGATRRYGAQKNIWDFRDLAHNAAIGHSDRNGSASAESGRTGQRAGAVRRGDVGNMARTDSQQRNGPGLGQSTGHAESANGGELGNVHSGGRKPRHETGCADVNTAVVATGADACELARTDSDGCEPGSVAAEAARYGQAADTSGWDGCAWIPCTDGKWRPTQSGVFPLAHGIPKGMGPLAAALERLGVSAKDARSLRRDGARILRSARAYSNSQIKGYGNAIVPQVAAEFIRSVM